MHKSEDVLRKTLDIVSRNSVSEAIKLQNEIAESIVLEDHPNVRSLIFSKKPTMIAGIDLSYPGGKALACAAIIKFYPDSKSYEIVEEESVLSEPGFPYIPGLLAFREIPAVAELMKKIKNRPQIVFFDGHGIAHPRRTGIATHFSLAFGIPAIGIAKKKLTGNYIPPDTSYEEVLKSDPERFEEEPELFRLPAGTPRNSNFFSPLIDKSGNQIGWALKLKKRTREIFASPGSMVSMKSTLRLTIMLYDGYKLPAPTRVAHNLTQRIYKI